MKKLFNIVLILVMILVILTGCRGDKSVDTSQSGSVSTDTAQTNPVEEATVEDSSIQTDSPAVEKPMRVEILDKTFKDIGQYSEGLCPVLDPTSGLWGYVDKTGEYVIEPQYYEAASFSEELAAVKGMTGTYTFIDKTGKNAFPGEFASVGQRYYLSDIGFIDDLAVVRYDVNGSCNLIDKSGNVVKELGTDSNYNIGKVRFINTGNAVMSIDDKNSIYDQQYNKLAEFKGYSPTMGGSYRILFNYSTKYLILQDKAEGIFVGAADGNKVFEENTIPGNTKEFFVAVNNAVSAD